MCVCLYAHTQREREHARASERASERTSERDSESECEREREREREREKEQARARARARARERITCDLLARTEGVSLGDSFSNAANAAHIMQVLDRLVCRY